MRNPLVRLWAVAILLLGACIPDATAPTAGPGVDAPPLRAAAEAAGKKVGTAFMAGRLGESAFALVAARHFDSLTPENEMKWDTIRASAGELPLRAR